MLKLMRLVKMNSENECLKKVFFLIFHLYLLQICEKITKYAKINTHIVII